ncbi:MAG TPA: DUF4352 domain-containing protein [Planctomycetota bacterium]|nr:DUF4352 domain-containing protein [Planctomycetota bacterium]
MRAGRALGAAAAVLALALGAAFLVSEHAGRTVGVGEWVRSGGVGFRVLAVRRCETYGIGESAVRGSFLVVQLEVTNHLVPLDYRFDPRNAVLLDGEGREHPPAEEARKRADAASGRPDAFAREFAPGGSISGELVYEVPPGLGGARLRVSMGVERFGKVLSSLLGGERFIVLSP